MELSLVVATHADPLGLYLSVFSALQQLEKSELTWEMIIAADGGTSCKYEKIPKVKCLRLTGDSRTGSPQGTRDAGIRAAKYANVAVIESHVVVSDFKRWLQIHLALGNPALSFPARIGETDELFSVYGTETDWAGDLWIKKHLYQPYSEPRRTAQFGHAAFIVNREWYLESGGYSSLQKGWGGEEPYLCLKAWMLGQKCWVVPEIWFAHYLTPGAHQDFRTSESFLRNIAILKFVMTGERGNLATLTPDILDERRRICEGPFQGDIEKLKTYLKIEGII